MILSIYTVTQVFRQQVETRKPWGTQLWKKKFARCKTYKLSIIPNFLKLAHTAKVELIPLLKSRLPTREKRYSNNNNNSSTSRFNKYSNPNNRQVCLLSLKTTSHFHANELIYTYWLIRSAQTVSATAISWRTTHPIFRFSQNYFCT